MRRNRISCVLSGSRQHIREGKVARGEGEGAVDISDAFTAKFVGAVTYIQT